MVALIYSLTLIFYFSTTVDTLGQWKVLPGKAIDIASSQKVNSLWHIGESGTIFKWNDADSSWENYGGNADRITVTDDGIPWIINNLQIYRLHNRTWLKMPGKARDIGSGGGQIWSIGQSGKVYRWNEETFIWEDFSGNADNIAVDSEGIPWITNDLQIYRLRGTVWQNIPGKARDIGISGSDVWIVGESHRIFKLNQSDYTWMSYFQDGMRITVNSDGCPIIITRSPNRNSISYYCE